MRRLLMVGFVPCGLFVTCLWVLVRAGSFAGRSDWARVIPGDLSGQVGSLLALTACTSVLALLLQPFQVRAVRVLEGYWDRWPVTARMAGVLVEMQRRRRQQLSERAKAGARSGANARRVEADAFRRLVAGPPEDVLLPTMLGNALRAGEVSAGERYGLTTLSSWPQIHMQVSERMSQVLHSARNALDISVNLCWSFLASGAVAAPALYDEPVARWAPLVAGVLAAVAYKGAVTAAQAYSGLMHVAYDLYRFDLLEALHHPLPDKENEVDVFWHLSEFLAGQRESGLPYVHEGRAAGRREPCVSSRGESGTDDTDGPADT